MHAKAVQKIVVGLYLAILTVLSLFDTYASFIADDISIFIINLIVDDIFLVGVGCYFFSLRIKSWGILFFPACIGQGFLLFSETQSNLQNAFFWLAILGPALYFNFKVSSQNAGSWRLFLLLIDVPIRGVAIISCFISLPLLITSMIVGFSFDLLILAYAILMFLCVVRPFHPSKIWLIAFSSTAILSSIHFFSSLPKLVTDFGESNDSVVFFGVMLIITIYSGSVAWVTRKKIDG